MTDIAPGAWAASLTPLNNDLSIDTGAALAHMRWLLDQGAGGIAALGTTGEANSFSVAERTTLIEAVGKGNFAPARMLVGVGCCAAPDTIALTRATLDAGFGNVMMLPPFYYKNLSDEGVFQAYARVIEAVRDPRLRVLIYEFPLMTGFKFSNALLSRLQTAFQGVVIGIKNSSGDWPAMETMTKEVPGFKLYAGTEQYLLNALRAGAPGCISATANVTVAALADLFAHWQDPDADAKQDAITQRRLMLQQYPAIPALKEIMAQATGRPQWRNLRPPLINLSGADAAKLIGEAKAAGVFDAVKQ